MSLENIKTPEQWSSKFWGSCMTGDLDSIKTLCNREYSFISDIHGDREKGFRLACYRGHLEVVKFLTTSQDLLEAGHTFVNIHVLSGSGIRGAFVNGHLDVIQYLIEDNNLKASGHINVNIHAENDRLFELACTYRRLKVLSWLIFDFKIKKTEAIIEILKKYPDFEGWFRAREEKEKLRPDLDWEQTEKQKLSLTVRL